MSAKEAKAQAKAAKAYAKAQRPFWKKKRVLFPAALLLVILLAVAAGGGGGDDDTTNTSAVAAQGDNGVSTGFGTKDASADVKVGTLGDADILGFRKPELTITNNSSKRSNYFVELSLESADGKTQHDTANATAQNVEPGQSTAGTVLPFTKVKGAPADAIVKVKSVSRTAAS